jgi:hopene-associated glycosyltransferase HpnB
MTWTTLAALSLAIWLYLLLFRGGFWRADQRLGTPAPAPDPWPAVAAIVPARDEAEVIGRALGSVLAQDYPGRLHTFLVDDHSSDGTADQARAAARASARGGRFQLVRARALPPGWTGKLWALAEGLSRAQEDLPEARYLWFTDGDIAHDPTTLRRLVAKAEAERLDLVSLMAALSCRGFWERLLIPPFVFFFQKLYPFPWVNDPRRATAAAAGGCVLVSAEALEAAGGLAPIRGALIDDCALARAIKTAARGRGIWLGLATDSRSIRPYQGLGAIWEMVARSAYTQLRHSTGLLAGTLLALALTYVAPPVIALGAPLHGQAPAAMLALAAWGLMARAAWPTLKLYGQSPWLGPLLPLAALFYGAMTLDSAFRHWRGKGGAWKGRVQAPSGTVEQRSRDR